MIMEMAMEEEVIKFPTVRNQQELGLGKHIGSEDEWDSERKARFSEMKRESRAGNQIERFRDSSEVKDEDLDDQFYETSKEGNRVPYYKPFSSEFDDYVASERMGSGVSRAVRYGFEVGDMVWGKVKSHPWWPGQIFNEAFASPSVRRMSNIGHVLVAFFGDSSYGWFDPAELIPFEPHVAEKSLQTNSSNFANAVEEAMEEASRRSALGLTCKCRNPLNFRPTSVQGYFAVDVPDYELQAVYSSRQIKNARDSFSSAQALSFVKRCALAPQECGDDSIKFYQRKAAVCAFRRAVFEEFDETYEQAFRARSAYTSVKTAEPLSRAPSRETLGDPKSSNSAMKVKESTKEHKYLPKRREEASVHVLQRRTPYLQTPMKHKQAGLVSEDFTSSRGDIPGQESSVSKLSSDGDKTVLQESKVRMGEKPALFPEHERFEAMTSLKQFETGTHSISRSSAGDGIRKVNVQKRSSDEMTSENAPSDPKKKKKRKELWSELKKLTTSSSRGSTVDGIRKVNMLTTSSSRSSAGDGIGKVNVLRRSSGEINSENAPSELKKKKKKKNEPKSHLNHDSPDKRKALSSGEAWAKKSSQLGSAERNSNMLKVRNSKLDVVQLLSNLQALSLDPFFGSFDSNSIRVAEQFFLRFRSLVYHKRLVSSPPTGKPSKFTKTLNCTKEPCKDGKKRLSPDHQQEIPSTKKLKKTSLFKPMASDNQEAKKRANLAPLYPVRDDRGRVPVNAKAQPGKKTAPSGKEIEPTMLVMKFPHGTSLPSTALLMARFGRFGLLDQSAIKVLWKSSMCRVVFLYKVDAQTALRYASGSNSLFGNVNVTYFLRDVKASSAYEGHESKKAKTDEPVIKQLNQRLEGGLPVHEPNIQLKSCLKKTGNNGNGDRGTARVKFMLGGNETETPLPVSSINNENCASSSSVAMEFVSNNTQNIVPSTLPPIRPLSLQNSKAKPLNNNLDPVEPQLNPSQWTVDISQEMMKLLLKCNDVVVNVKSLLGYVPYHPL